MLLAGDLRTHLFKHTDGVMFAVLVMIFILIDEGTCCVMYRFRRQRCDRRTATGAAVIPTGWHVSSRIMKQVDCGQYFRWIYNNSGHDDLH